MPQKLRYEIDLSDLTPVATAHDLQVRSISRDDLDDLAGLMLNAYVGTIDYEGETLDDAIAEVTSFLDDDRALLDRSYLAGDGHETVILYITEGNTPSEALFRSVGAVQAES